MKRKKIDIEITELYMYKAGQDWHRRFMGTIKRDFDDSGEPVVCGRVEVGDCIVYSMASDKDQLGEQMDAVVLMVLDYDLHSTAKKTTKICDTDFFLN